MDWQPIKGAPLDEAVLLFMPYISEWRPSYLESNIVVGIGRRQHWRDGYILWVSDISECDDGYDTGSIRTVEIYPTHWMRLPEPPGSGLNPTSSGQSEK